MTPDDRNVSVSGWHTFRSFRQLELSATRSVRNAHPILSMTGPGDWKEMDGQTPIEMVGYSGTSKYTLQRSISSWQLMGHESHLHTNLCYWQCWIGMIRTLWPFGRWDGGQGSTEAVLQLRVGDDVVHELFVLLRMTKGNSSTIVPG